MLLVDTSPAARNESWASSDAARSTMRANRGRDTAPEMLVRRRVHALGLRYRVNVRPENDLRQTADLLFTRARVAVMIDGCFWHGCPEHYQAPKSNGAFWAEKVARNRARDVETTVLLEARGWSVIRIWEHEVRADADLVANQIVEAVTHRSPNALPQQRVQHRTEESRHSLGPDDEGTVEQQIR